MSLLPAHHDPRYSLYVGDCRAVLASIPDAVAQCCVTSPPYFGLRDYGMDGQIGLEPDVGTYVAEMVAVFREVRRVLKDDGVLWLNLGDSYSRAPTKGGSGTPNGRNTVDMGYTGAKQIPCGLKPKDLIGVPWSVAFALQADGWYLRSDIIWAKPNPMPESVTDRPTKAHEYVFLLTKSERYLYDADAVREESAEPGRKRADRFGGNKYVEGVKHSDGSTFTGATHRNARSVWTIGTQPYGGAHFATMPPKLAERCILAGSLVGDTVLDPFNGAGTTGMVAMQRGRRYVGVELNPEYARLSIERWKEHAAQVVML